MPRICDMPCVAPGCASNALLRCAAGPVCNLHYQRWITRQSFKNLPPRVRKTSFECAHCGFEFPRGYLQDLKRQAKPQYCSAECFASAVNRRAIERRSERFWQKVDKRGPDECWPYLAGKSPHGYGRFQWGDNRPVFAHRVAYELTHGVSPGDKFVCHSCDNPPCCNPAHLWLGTVAQNNADRDAKGRTRFVARRGEASNHAKLTAEQAIQIFKSRESPKSIASRFGITTTAVYLIRKGRNWAHVTGGATNA